MPNELDELMDLDPLSLSEQNLDAIIAYQRKYRAQIESGVKPKKANDGPKVSLSGVLDKLIPKVEGPKVTRRV